MGIAKNELCLFRWELGGKISIAKGSELGGVLHFLVRI